MTLDPAAMFALMVVAIALTVATAVCLVWAVTALVMRVRRDRTFRQADTAFYERTSVAGRGW